MRSQPVEITNFEIRPLQKVIKTFVNKEVTNAWAKEGDTHKMAKVICLPSILADEFQVIVLYNMLRVLLHEFLDTIPDRSYGVSVFIQTDNKAIFLLVVFHELERVETDVTEIFDAGLHSPIVVEFLEELLAEKESRFKTAHVSVADGISVDDLFLLHILPNLGGFCLVDKVRERPVLFRNDSIMRFPRYKSSSYLYELVVEGHVIKKDPVIVIIPVESVLHLADRLGDLPNIPISGQSHECCVYSFIGRCWNS